MVLNTAESLKDIWASIFRRKGGDGAYTRLFDNLDASQRAALLSVIKLRESEVPVIGSVENSDTWLLLTTERLVWSVGGERRDVPADAVRDAKADHDHLLKNRSKVGMRRPRVVTIGGEEYPIEIESGAPLIAVWNVLMNLCRRNRRLIKK